MLGVFTSASTKLVLDHVEQQDRGLDKLQIATAAMDGANEEGEKTKKVLLPLIKASKCWSVGNLFNLDNRDDWAAPARCSESGKIGEIMIMDYGYLRGAAQEDVKKVLDISLRFAIVDIGRRGGYFGGPDLLVVKGGMAEDPEADWKMLVERAGLEN